MAVLVKNIKKLVQVETAPIPFRAGREMSNLPCIDDAYLLVADGKIFDFGKMSGFSEKMLEKIGEPVEVVDAAVRMVFPTFCDSHSHIVYAGRDRKSVV